jgi:hypothetical protein
LGEGERRMQTQTGNGPWWAALTVWAVVNTVSLLQSVGFLSRIPAGSMATNQLLGYVMIALAAPAGLALVVFLRARAGWLQLSGPIVYLAFVALMIIVDYVSPIEWRSPARYEILAPYLLLFFGAILLMGLPMYWRSRAFWMVTAGTTVLLLGSMVLALRGGVG